MPRTQLFRKLHAKIEERINSVGDSVLRGDPKSYEEYRYWVGYVEGIKDALKLADDIEGELD